MFLFFDFILFRRHAFYPIKTMVLAHSTLSENLNYILKTNQQYQISSQCRYHFRIEFSSIFMTFSASISTSIFSSNFNGKWLQNGSKKHPGNPSKSMLFATLSESRFLDAFWSPFGPPFGFPFGSLWSLLGFLWLTFGSLWLTFGALWLPFGFLWLPFGSLLVPFGSLLVPLGSHFCLTLVSFWLTFGVF